MPLYLTEQDVEQLITVPDAIEALEAAFLRQSQGQVINVPRSRLFLPDGTYHTMVAADLGLGTFAIKAYTSFRPKTRFVVLLYAAADGALLAMIEADRLGQTRTGAASGVATRCLAVDQPRLRMGILGTGWQARSQVQAVCAVRDIAEVIAFSRDAGRRAAFCSEVSAWTGVPVRPAETAEEAVREMDIVTTATSAREPVLMGKWLKAGAHINAVGGNLLMKAEVDTEAVRRSDVIVVDSIEQSRLEAGDLLAPYEQRLFRWEQVRELSDVVGGVRPGRESGDQITLFKSNGIAMEDVAVATLVYRRAQERGTGAAALPVRT